MSWASGEIHHNHTTPKSQISKHGHLNKAKSNQKQAKHQGGAGQARRSKPSTKLVQGKPPGEEQDKF
jgi:hypothetical protein